MNTITVNGVTIQTNAKNISVINGRVILDGKEVELSDKIISITVNGDIESINADALNEINVSGSVKGDIQTGSGNVSCGGVGGSVSLSSGSIRVLGSVGDRASSQSGSISYGGDIKGNVSNVSGNISDGGSVKGSCRTMSGNIF